VCAAVVETEAEKVCIVVFVVHDIHGVVGVEEEHMHEGEEADMHIASKASCIVC
jgi:hypothetical protein